MRKISIVLFGLLALIVSSCSRLQPNTKGVLMTNYGRDSTCFKEVTGWQWTVWPGTELFSVPQWEQKGDPEAVYISAKDAGQFVVDPIYTYRPVPGKSISIIFNYKHVGVTEPQVMMDNIEAAVLNQLVVNAYREEARNYTTDSLMNNLNSFEHAVEARLTSAFFDKFFVLTNLTSGLKPPESMAHAIEARNNAIQQAEQVKNEVEVSKMNLEKARIDAEANRIRAAGLDDKVLLEKWIEALRNTDNKVIITDGKTPLMLGGQ